MNRNRKPEFLKEFEEPERVYYGNVCNKCFSKLTLFNCQSCKKVQYCSVLHKQEDLQFHNNVCSVVANYTFPKVMDNQKFLYERWTLLNKMRDHRSPYPLTRYEREICMLPWACIVCFKGENLNFGCDTCLSVAYCSAEHQKADEAAHKKICSKLNLCRTFSSLGYQFGIRVKPIEFTYKPIREKERRFPKEMKDLLKLLQKQLRTPCDDIDAINSGVFTDRFASAATVLSCLESIGVITNRKYNFLPNKNLFQVVDFKPRPRNANAKMSAQFVIHMVSCYDYEMQMPWITFVGLILDWVKNIHFVKIILVGEGLKQFPGFNFSNIQHIASYECYPTRYENVVDQLERPDVILVHNFGYPNMNCLAEFLSPEAENILFKFSKVPVIITIAFPFFLQEMMTCYSKFKQVELVSGLRSNMFCECSAIRWWGKEGFQCGHHNEYVCVYRRK